MIEDTNSNATLNTNLTKVKGMEDSMNIHGYVTVIKNVGTDSEEVICKDKHNLLTNSGRDWMHAQVYTNTSAGTSIEPRHDWGDSTRHCLPYGCNI